MTRTLAIVAAVVCLVTAGRLDAGYGEGMSAFARGDYDSAYKELRPLAEKGEPGAQFTLGFMYDYGQGVPQNTQEAIWWYRNAAEQGIAVAQFSLGEIYEGGRGTPQDLAEAFRWYSLAVENLSPGEIRDSVIERRDALAGKLSPAEIAVVTALMKGARGQNARAAEQATGVAPEAPEAAGQAAGDSQEAALVAAIQGELARLGYELDWQIGSLDQLTRGAIQAFEIESGREITGRPSDDLLTALRATERPAAPAAAPNGPVQDGAAPGGDGGEEAADAAQPETVVAALDQPGVTAAGAVAESTLEVPSGAAGGPLIPLDDEADAAQRQQETQPETTQRAARPEGAPQDERRDEEPAGAPLGIVSDLQFIERQIQRLDTITARVDGPSAAVPGWDALEVWEIETRGLLAARLGQEIADGLMAERQAPVVGDPYGNFHHTSAAYRGYLSVLLKRVQNAGG